MPWWGWVIIGCVVVMFFTLRFLRVCKNGREAGDRAAAEHYGYEYKGE